MSVPARLFASLLALLSTSACSGQTDAPQGDGGDGAVFPPVVAKVEVGVNLAEISYYASELPWVDAFRSSSPFTHQREGEWELKEPLEKRPDGYPARLKPGSWAGTLMFAGLDGHYPAGTYTCLYDGVGKIEFEWSAKVVGSKKGKMTVEVNPSDAGIWMRIVETNPKDPVRNIRFIMPGFAGTYEKSPWHPDFIERWKDFAVLRFQEWTRTNNSKVKEWSERTLPDAQTQGGEAGVAWEHVIALANHVKSDPWICIPHQASDDYIQELAELFKEKLDPKLTVYLEYSNEVWNGQFEQAHYAAEQGQKLGLSGDGYEAQLRFHSERSVFIFKTFAKVFGSTKRLHRTLGAQSANDWTTETVVEWKDAYKHADSVTIAPYFGGYLGDPQTQSTVVTMRPEQILEGLDDHIDKVAADIFKHRKKAERRGLEVVAYEGGQHLVGYLGAENNEKMTALFLEVNRRPEMERLYEKYLKLWKKNGGGLFVAFNSTMGYSKWGSWGAFENYDQKVEDAPKYRALIKFMKSLKR